MTIPVYFAHANGLPAACYQTLWQHLQDAVAVSCLPVIGMNPDYPVTLNWLRLVDEVLDDMQKRYAQTAVSAVGHSFGGLLLWLCALKQPQRFQQLVLLDPPLVMGYQAAVFEQMQRLGLSWVDKLSPAGITLKRKDVWDSREAAYAALRGNRLFQRVEEGCFEDFIAHGLVEDEQTGVVRLRIPKTTEAHIFRTFPTYWWRIKAQTLPMPVHLITAKQGEFYQSGASAKFARKFGIQMQVMDGAHLFPLEQTVATAQLLRSILLSQQMKTPA